MKKFPDLFQQLFVPGEAELKGAHVITLLNFPPSLSEEETTKKGNLLVACPSMSFCRKQRQKCYRSFLFSQQGHPVYPTLGMGKLM